MVLLLYYYRNTINLAHSISERAEMNKVYFAKKLSEISEVKNKTRKLTIKRKAPDFSWLLERN